MSSSSASDDEDMANTLRGLVGLQNLGNTCYMNGALQALSNCQQLTRFVLDCPSFLKEKGLSHSYSELMREMWTSRSSQYAVPASIIRNIKCIYPAFRGCSQQDSQEFLRCFLEQLHDELKQPTPVPVSKSRRSWRSSCSTSPTSTTTTTTTTTISQKGDTSLTKARDDRCPGAAETESGSNTSSCSSASTSSSLNSNPKESNQTSATSIISDTFEFKISSSVVCSCCNNISTTIETFKDLSIPIATYTMACPPPPPTPPTANASSKSDAANKPQVHQSSQSDTDSTSETGSRQLQTSNSLLSYLPLARWFWTWLGYFNDWFWGPQVTLQDCLTIFFGTDPLEGDNEYSCEVCTKKNRGVKFLRISELPEVLCIHFKRYESVGSAKITTHVSFPLTGLDLAQYMSEDSRPQCTTYNLIACICHHGSALLTGHYTTYALNCYDNQWYEFDDQFVSSVESRQVENSEAYILFYQKSTLDDTIDRQRVKASRLHKKSLLSSLNQNNSQPNNVAEPAVGDIKKYFISKLWISKFNTFVEPGPITNYDFLCAHRRVPRKLEPFLKDLCHPVSKVVWRYLKRLHGGGPVCRQLESCQLCE